MSNVSDNANNNRKKQIKSNLIAFVMIFGIFYGYIFLSNSGTKCFFKSMTGIPCPSCGMTRSYVHLFHGEIGPAFIDHPLFITIPFIGLAVLLSYLFYNNKKIRKVTNVFLIIMVITFISVYIYRMVMFFPHTEPLRFYEQGIVPRLYNVGKNIMFSR